jgi:predicted metalloendopeptidase
MVPPTSQFDNEDQEILSKIHKAYTLCLHRESEPSTAYNQALAVMKAFGSDRSPLEMLAKASATAKILGVQPFFQLRLARSGDVAKPLAWLIKPKLPHVHSDVFKNEEKLTTLIQNLLWMDRDSLTWKGKADKVKNSVDQIRTLVEHLLQHCPLAAKASDGLFDISVPVTLKAIQSEFDGMGWATLTQELISHLNIRGCQAGNANCPVASWVHSNRAELHQLNQIWKSIPPALLRLYMGIVTWISFETTLALHPGNSGERRSEHCLDAMYAMFPMIPIRWMRKMYLTQPLQVQIETLFQQLKQVYQTRLASVPGWDAPTQGHAYAKLQSMTLEIGYHEFLHRPDVMTKLMSYVDTTETWSRVVLSHGFHRAAVEFLGLINPAFVTTGEIGEGMVRSNGQYATLWNTVSLSPFSLVSVYHQAFAVLPEIMLYAVLGPILAHEIAHGLTYDGKNFNSQGVANPWWNRNTLALFKHNVMMPVQNAFGQWRYPLDHRGTMERLNSKLTGVENVADMMGFSIAYRTWVAHGNVTGPMLSGFPLSWTPRHLFYVLYAQDRCESYSIEGNLRYRNANFAHAPNQATIFNVLRHHVPFAQTFQCDPSKEAMCSNRPIHII